LLRKINCPKKWNDDHFVVELALIYVSDYSNIWFIWSEFCGIFNFEFYITRFNCTGNSFKVTLKYHNSFIVYVNNIYFEWKPVFKDHASLGRQTRWSPCFTGRQTDRPYKYFFLWLGVMVFNTTFNNISVISWRQFCWWRKPPTCHKSLTNFITSCCIYY
jgi:hypothetical protein